MKHPMILLLAILCAGCSTYRVSSNVPAPAPEQRTEGPILLLRDAEPARPFRELGPIDVTVYKGNLFVSAPQQAQADSALIQKARDQGAEAVIRIRYESGFNVLTNSYIKARGVGIRFKD